MFGDYDSILMRTAWLPGVALGIGFLGVILGYVVGFLIWMFTNGDRTRISDITSVSLMVPIAAAFVWYQWFSAYYDIAKGKSLIPRRRVKPMMLPFTLAVAIMAWHAFHSEFTTMGLPALSFLSISGLAGLTQESPGQMTLDYLVPSVLALTWATILASRYNKLDRQTRVERPDGFRAMPADTPVRLNRPGGRV